MTPTEYMMHMISAKFRVAQGKSFMALPGYGWVSYAVDYGILLPGPLDTRGFVTARWYHWADELPEELELIRVQVQLGEQLSNG